MTFVSTIRLMCNPRLRAIQGMTKLFIGNRNFAKIKIFKKFIFHTGGLRYNSFIGLICLCMLKIIVYYF